MINVHNFDDDECFEWILVRYLHPADCHSARITKAEKDFAKNLNEFPVKVRDIHKIEKEIPSELVLLVMKIRENVQSMNRKNVLKKNMLIYY